MTLGRTAAAEAIGTALLLAIVVGIGDHGRTARAGERSCRLARECACHRSWTLYLNRYPRTDLSAHFNPVVSVFVQFGKSMVTGAEISFHLHHDRI